MSVGVAASHLLENVEALIAHQAITDPDRVKRPGWVNLASAAADLRTEIALEADGLSNPGANTEGIAAKAARRTSQAAAWAMKPKTGTQRSAVLEAITESVPLTGGMTDEELRALLGLRYSSSCARRGELVTGGWVEDSGHTRPTSTGQDAIVWTLTAAGHQRLSAGAS